MSGENDAPTQRDLSALSDQELSERLEQLRTEFDALYSSENLDANGLAQMSDLADEKLAIEAEQNARRTQVTANQQRREELAAQFNGAQQTSAETEVTAETETSEPEPVTASTSVRDRQPRGRNLNPSLGDLQRHAPKPDAPDTRTEPVLVASSDIPGFTHGGKIENMAGLVAAMTARARTMAVTRLGDNAPRTPIASMIRDFRFRLGPDAGPEEVNEVLQAAADPSRLADSAGLVAAGGWCSPSEISYDFFNVVCEDGMLDVPTVGIDRGGWRYPVSASYQDIVASQSLWTWTETQDVAAATGTGQSGTKTCARVPCPTFNEDRLRCDGLCLTVGNLMDDSFPELIANHTRLLFAGHAHRLNTIRINALVNLSTAVNFTVTGSGVWSPVMGAIELQAIDYRERFRMCDDSVLEVILPRWLRGALRSDIAKRMGAVTPESLTLADAVMMSAFNARNVRVQWVTDWQVGTTGLPGQAATNLTAWPSTVQFMMYAAGTFVMGQGLQLNLGIIRDSVLNETNDFTAEWMEECWLISKIGHESRLVTVPICPSGRTGAADQTVCAL